MTRGVPEIRGFWPLNHLAGVDSRNGTPRYYARGFSHVKDLYKVIPVSKKISKPGKIHLQIVEVMKRFPAGVSGGQIRQELGRAGLQAEVQTHLDSRKRDLKVSRFSND